MVGLRRLRTVSMILALRVLHIAVAAAWFGHKLLVPGDIRRSVQAGRPEDEALLIRLKRAERLGQVTGIGTVLTGAALAWAVGVETVSFWIWVGLGIVVVAIAIGATIARPASKRLHEAVRRGDRVDATVAAGRVNRVLGFEGLLWVGALATMLL